MSIGNLIKSIAPVLIGAASGGAGAGLGSLFGIESPFLQRALIGGLTSKAMGGKNKDAIRDMLLSGVGGMAFDNFKGQQQVVQDGQNLKPGQFSRAEIERNQLVPTGSSGGTSTIPAEQATKKIAESFKPKTFSGELLQAAGVGEDNLLSRLLNTRMGEGLTAGLIAQLLAGDDEEDTRREFERRPFGQGGPGGQLGGIRFAADGGQMGFPRRNGGIDPSEGSGTKDDVPAMLMAGEFVLTKDAVKGLGDGNQRKGIQRAYDMMDNLEARA